MPALPTKKGKQRQKAILESAIDVFIANGYEGILSRRAIGAARLIYSESARFPDIGKWYYEQGALLSYSCFAKVLENHIGLDFEELKGISRIYIEMLKNNIYLKALCLPGFEPDDAMIARDVAESAEIIKTHIRKRISAKPD